MGDDGKEDEEQEVIRLRRLRRMAEGPMGDDEKKDEEQELKINKVSMRLTDCFQYRLL